MSTVTVTFTDANGLSVDVRAEFGETGMDVTSPAHQMAAMMISAISDNLETSAISFETSEVPNG